MSRLVNTSAMALVSATGILVGACGGAAATPSPSTKPLATVSIGEQVGTAANLPFIVAIDQGFFKSHGIDAKRVSIGNAGVTLSAITSGSIDTISQTPPYVAQVRQQGADLTYFCGNVVKSTATILVHGDSTYKLASQVGWQAAVQQLKGTKVGVPARGGAPELVYNALFKDAGVSSPNVTYIGVGVGQPALTAFTNGQVDNMYGYAFIGQQLVSAGKAKVLIDTSKDGPTTLVNATQNGFISTSKWLGTNKATARSFCAALSDAMAWIKDAKNVAAVNAIASKEFGVEAGVVAQARKDYFPNFDSKINMTYLQNAIDFGVQSGQIKMQPAVTANDLVFKL